MTAIHSLRNMAASTDTNSLTSSSPRTVSMIRSTHCGSMPWLSGILYAPQQRIQAPNCTCLCLYDARISLN